MFRSPAHVYLRPSGYYCCISVPEKLRGIVKRHQIRHPLRTHRLSVAKHRARFVSFYLKGLFDFLRSSAMKQFTEADIDPIVQVWLRVALALGNSVRNEFASLDGSPAGGFFDKERQQSVLYEEDARNTLATGDYSIVSVLAHGLLEENGFEAADGVHFTGAVRRGSVNHAIVASMATLKKPASMALMNARV